MNNTLYKITRVRLILARILLVTYTINPLAELSNRAKSYKDKSQIKPNVPLV